MFKKNLVALLCLGLFCNTSTAQIITYSNPHAANKSTDFLQAGNLKIGISSRAGGAINSFIIPTAVGASSTIDIMGNQAETYGRLGQSDIRDLGHSKRYNPTQAGFKEEWGTPRTVQCLDANDNIVTANPVKLKVLSSKLSLWDGDSKYDYIYKSNIVSDIYHDVRGVALNDDEDNIDELGRGISQGEEITSEFRYTGAYENVMSQIGVTTPVIYHTYNYAFFDNPVDNGITHAAPFSAMQQFTAVGGAAHPTDYTLSPPAPSSTPVFDATQVRNMTTGPNNTAVTGGDKDLNNLWASWFMRWDNALLSNGTTYRYKLRTNGTWTAAENRAIGFVGSVARGYKTAVIISEASTATGSGRSIGFYRPTSSLNTQSIIGQKTTAPLVPYTYNRTDSVIVQENGDGSVINMSAAGFRHFSKGILNINTLQSKIGAGYYETYRAECFILYASTPQGVMNAIDAIDTYLLNHSNTFNTSSSLLAASAKDNIELVNGAHIYIYPNPVIDIVNIKVTKPTSVNIYSVDGKLVFSKNNVSSNIAIPVNQIGKKGTYFIKTDTETKKLIIAQ